MRLATLSDAVRPLRTLGEGDPEIESVTYSAGEVEPGALHVCVPGFRRDGHEFASQAVERGAVALIVERELDVPVPQLVVESSRRAMAQAADAFYGHPSRALQMVGVTGPTARPPPPTCCTRCWTLPACGRAFWAPSSSASAAPSSPWPARLPRASICSARCAGWSTEAIAAA